MTFTQEANATTQSASVHATGGGVRGCYGPTFGRFAVFGCGDAELDWMWANGATGPGITKARAANGGWATVGAGAGARFNLGRDFALRADIAGLVPLAPPSFVTSYGSLDSNNSVVHKPFAIWDGRGWG